MTGTASVPGAVGGRVRVEFIDGLRALAALYVLLHHAWATVFPINLDVHPEGALSATTGWLGYGHVGVTVFIVLAGYSLTIAVAPRNGELRGGFWTFLWRRAKRIIPPYWFAIALTALLALTIIPSDTGTHWDQSVPFDWSGLPVNLLLLQDLIPVQNVSYVFWSVAVEWHIYLLFPLILLIWRRWNAYAGIAVGVCIGLAGIVLARFLDPVNNLWPAYYAAFALGVGARTLAHYRPAWSSRIPWGLAGGAVLLVTSVVTVSHSYLWLVAHMKPIDLLFALGLAAVLVSLSTGRSGWLARALSVRWLVGIGAFSYSVYLVHAPLLQIGWQYGVRFLPENDALRVTVMLLVVAPIAVALAWCFYWVFERPFIGSWRRNTAEPAPVHLHAGRPEQERAV